MRNYFTLFRKVRGGIAQPALWLASLALLAVMATDAEPAEVVDRIAAIVNGQMITLSEIEKNVKLYLEGTGYAAGGSAALADRQLQKKVLERMIDDILLAEKATKLKLTVAENEIEEFIRDFKKQNQFTQDMLLERLRLDGMTMEEYRNKIKQMLLRSKILNIMVQRKAVVTDEEVQAYFEEHKSEFGSNNTAHVALIVLPATGDAVGLKAKIQKGDMSFVQAAKTLSIGPNAENGGDLGEIEFKNMASDLRRALENAKTGEIVGPFSLAGNTALAQVISMQGGAQPTSLDAVRGKVVEALRESKLDKLFYEYVQRLREEAVIEIRI